MSIALEKLLKRYGTLFQWKDRDKITISTRGVNGDYPIHTASMTGSPEEIRLLLNHGADINAKGENDFTPLHSAVEFQNHENVKFLLKAGASLADVNTFGQTPRDLAEVLEHYDIHMLFVEFEGS